MISKKVSLVVVICTIAIILMSMSSSLNRGEVIKDVLYSSIVWVESKGNPNAKSKDGSVGMVQIKPVMVSEINRICRIIKMNKKFTLADRKSPDKSREMFFIYQEFYHPNLNWDDVTINDMEQIARKWNGGPIGHKKKATKKYWKKVSKKLYAEMNNIDNVILSSN